MSEFIERPPLDCNFSELALDLASTWFLVKHGVSPQTLLISPMWVDEAYGILSDSRRYITVVAVPGLPCDAWMLVAPQGIYGCPGT